MNITNVKIWLVNSEKLIAYASIVIDDAFMVRDIKLIKTDKGIFVAMPNKKMKDGSFMDLAHPLNTEAREIIEQAVITEYKNRVNIK